MGKIFSFEEVRCAAVPEKSAFSHAWYLIHDALVKSPAILGAQHCGSLARKDYSRRSDADVAVVYDGTRAEEARKLFRMLHVVVGHMHVPLDLIAISQGFARTRDHTWDPLFLEHLKRLIECDTRQIVKVAPTVLVQPNRKSAVDDVRSYIAHKHKQFQGWVFSWPTLDDQEKARALQKALEFPYYAMRKMLAVTGVQFTHGDGKKEVCRLCKITHGLVRYAAVLERIEQVDALYDEQLDRQLQCPDDAVYTAHLEQLADELPVALWLAEELLAELA